MRMLGKILRLRVVEAWALAEGVMWLLAMPMLLGLLGAPRLCRRARRRAGGSGNCADREKLSRVAGLIAAAGRRMPARNQCLHIALAILFHSAFRGAGAQLRLGLRGRPFAAHAWVELDRQVMGECRDVRDHWQLMVGTG